MTSTLFGRATALLDEHTRLQALIERLRLLERSGDLPVAARVELHRLLGQFYERLRAHLAAEESDDYFGTLVTEAPALRVPIERLREEHCQLLVVSHHLVTLSEVGTPGDEFAARLRTLLERFDEHERSETRLVREFFRRSGNSKAM